MTDADHASALDATTAANECVQFVAELGETSHEGLIALCSTPAAVASSCFQNVIYAPAEVTEAWFSPSMSFSVANLNTRTHLIEVSSVTMMILAWCGW